jgi:hypothetical protein
MAGGSSVRRGWMWAEVFKRDVAIRRVCGRWYKAVVSKRTNAAHDGPRIHPKKINRGKRWAVVETKSAPL